MKKIFHVISSIDLGGSAERVAINIAKSKNKEFEYHLVEVIRSDSDFSNQLKKELQANGIKYHLSIIRKKKLAILFFWTWFLWLYLKERPNIIHSHTEVPDLSLWIFRKVACLLFWIRPKYIRTIHNTELWNDWKWIGKIVEKYYIRKQSNIAISDSVRNNYMKAYSPRPIPVIYNGVSVVDPKPFHGIIAGKLNILFAGRMELQKGIDILVKLINRLNNNDHIYFHVVGSGTMEKDVKECLAACSFVSIYDKVYNLSAYLGSFDYLIMPSRHEGLALMPIEASLAHTPTIINQCQGLAETLPQNWPLCVKNNSVEEYVAIFEDILKGNIDRNYLADMAFNFTKEHFNISTMQKQYEKIYEEKCNDNATKQA